MLDIEANSIDLYEVRTALESGACDVVIDGDSISVPLVDRGAPWLAWVMQAIGGALPTRISTGVGAWGTERSFGSGILDNQTTPDIAQIGPEDADPWKVADGRVSASLAAKACTIPYDGTVAFGTNGANKGVLGAIYAQSWTGSANALTTAGALSNVILPDVSNEVLVELFGQAGDNGFPDRDIEIWNGNTAGSIAATFNPSDDVAGYPHLGEDPSTARADGAIAHRMARFLPSAVITNQFGSQVLRGFLTDSERRTTDSNDAIDDGTRLTFTGMILARASSGVWVGGSSLICLGGTSTNIVDRSLDREPDSARPKSISTDGLTHLIGAAHGETDVDRPALVVVMMATEAPNGGESMAQYTARVRDDKIAIVDAYTAAFKASKRRPPRVLLYKSHRQGNRTLEQEVAWSRGMMQAAIARHNASAFDGAGYLDNVVFDGGAEAQAYAAANSLDTLTLGHYDDEDVSGADHQDGTHQNSEVSAAFYMNQLRTATANAQPQSRQSAAVLA